MPLTQRDSPRAGARVETRNSEWPSHLVRSAEDDCNPDEGDAVAIGYVFESVKGNGRKAKRVGSFVLDTPAILERAQELEADPSLPDDISLGWADAEDYVESGEPEDEEADRPEYWPAREVLSGVRWLHGLAVAADRRIVSPQDASSARHAALLRELEQVIHFLEDAEKQNLGVRCVAVP